MQIEELDVVLELLKVIDDKKANTRLVGRVDGEL